MVGEFQQFYCQKKDCNQSRVFLSFILMIGTAYFAIILFEIKKSKFFWEAVRSNISSYALPISVTAFSLIGSLPFHDIDVNTFSYGTANEVKIVDFKTVELTTFFISIALGFCLSILIFMSQNINTVIVDNPDNRLQKGKKELSIQLSRRPSEVKRIYFGGEQFCHSMALFR